MVHSSLPYQKALILSQANLLRKKIWLFPLSKMSECSWMSLSPYIWGVRIFFFSMQHLASLTRPNKHMTNSHNSHWTAEWNQNQTTASLFWRLLASFINIGQTKICFSLISFIFWPWLSEDHMFTLYGLVTAFTCHLGLLKTALKRDRVCDATRCYSLLSDTCFLSVTVSFLYFSYGKNVIS